MDAKKLSARQRRNLKAATWSLTSLPLICLVTGRAQGATIPLAETLSLADGIVPDQAAAEDAPIPAAMPAEPQPEADLGASFSPPRPEIAGPEQAALAPVPVMDPPLAEPRFAEPSQPVAPTAPSESTLRVPQRPEPPLLAQAITPANDGTNTTVTTEGNRIDIQGGTLSENGANLFHSFQAFGLEAGQIANFLANPDIANIVSRVTGGDISSINGLIQVSGGKANLYLINPAGVLFGADAQLNLSGSFTATTADRVGFGDQMLDVFSQTDYRQLNQAPDSFVFSATEAGSIINQGTLAVSAGEAIRLIGGEVVNLGTLSAPGGEITILAVPGENVVRLRQENQLLSLEISATPATDAANPVPFTPATIPQLLTGGQLSNANALTLNPDGSVTLSGAEIPTGSGSVVASGSLDTAGTTGGQINVLGKTVGVIDATLEASGDFGGGTIRIGGEYKGEGTLPNAETVSIDQNSALQADALTSGDGGRVIVWADDATQFDGSISARGGSQSGDGGFVETSGRNQLTIGANASVNTSAANGEMGTWLLDPADLEVVGSGGTAGVVGGTNSPTTASSINASTIVSALNGTNVNLQATNSITVNAAINASGNANAGNLQLSTPIANLNQRITLRSGSTLSGTATTVNVGAGGSVQNGVDVVATGGTVNLAAATYREGSEVAINRAMAVQGQGPTQTIISGDANNDGTGDHRVFNIGGTGPITLDGFAAIYGNANGGAGLYNTSTNLTVNNSLFTNHVSSDLGGAIRNTAGGIMTVNNSTFSNNWANDDGGAIYNGDVGSRLTVTNSTANNNRTETRGGGIANGNDGITEIRNSTISNNTSRQHGAGLYNNTNGTLTVLSSTIANNASEQEGGGIRNEGGGSTVSFGNTIIAGNSSPTNGPDARGDYVDLGNNLIGKIDDSSGFTSPTTLFGTSLSPLDPLLAPLSNYGGPTQTHALLPNSPAINRGNATGTDQRGVPRPVTSASDIGAYESTGFSLIHAGGSNQATAVNTNFANPLRVRVVENSFNTPIPGITVQFFAPNSPGFAGATFGGSPTVVTDASGLATSPTLTANTTTGTFSASVNGVGTGITMLFNALTNAAGAPNSLSIVGGNNQNTTVNTAFTNPLSVEVRDQFNNVIPNATVTFTPPGSGASGTLLSATVTTNASGRAVTPFTANTVAGTYGVAAQLGSLAATFNLTNNPDLPNNLVLVGGNNQSATVNTNFGTNLQVRVQDQYGNTVPNATVNFASPGSGSSGAFSGSNTISVTANASGLATAPVFRANTIAGGYSVAASTTTGAANNSFSLTNTPDVPDSLSIIGGNNQNTTVNTAFASALAVQVSDQYGNVIPNATVTFTPPGSGASGTPASATVTTDASGRATTFFTANTVAGSYGVAAALGSLAANFSLTNNPDVPSNLILTSGDGQSATVNTAFATDLGVRVEDQYGNVVPNAVVTFSSPATGAGGTAATATVTTDTGGQASTAFTANTVAGSYAVGATAGAATNNFNLTNTPDIPNTLTITAGDGQSTTVATNFATNLQVRVEDQYGNVVPNASVNFASPGTGSSGAFGGGNTATVITDGSGLASAPIFTANTLAGSYGVAAELGVLSANFNLTNNPDVPNSLVLIGGDGQSTTVNTAFANPLAVEVRDQYGNVVPNATVDFTAPGSGASGTATTSTVTTDASGQASTTFTANTVAGSYTVGAAAGAASNGFNLTNTPAGPSVIIAAGNNQSTTVATNFATNLQVRVEDQFGNVVPNATVNFAAPTTGASGNFSGSTLASVTTDGAGLATAPVFTANTIAGSYAVGAAAGTATNSFSLTNNPDVPNSLVLIGGDGQSTTVNTAFATDLAVQVEDQYGNVIPNATVNFAAPGTGASGTAANSSVTTDAAGQASTTFTANTIAGTYTVSATAGAAGNGFNLTNTPDVPNSLTITAGDGQSTTVATNFATNLQVRVQDQYGNVVPNASVNFAAPGSGSSGAFGGSNTASVTTDTAGLATAPIFTANTIAGGYAVGATAGAANNSFSLTNNPDVPNSLVLIGGDGQSTTVNTAFANPLAVEVRDQYGNVVPNATVDFTAPGSGASGTATTSTVTTDASGQASTTFTANTVAGSYTVGATAGTASDGFNLTNTPAGPNVIITAGNNQSTTVATNFATNLQVRVEDQFGNVVPNATVNFAAPTIGASGNFSGSTLASVTTDAAGLATAPIFTANTIAGSYAVGATAGAATNSFSLINNPDVPNSLVLLGGDGQSTTVNTAFAADLAVRVEDQYGNVIPNATVNFTAPGTGASGTAATSSVTTDAAGQASTTFTANTIAGTYTVSAAAGTASNGFNLTNAPDAPSSLTITAGNGQSTTVATNFATNLQVRVQDQFGNIVPNATVNFAAPGSGSSGDFGGIATASVTTDGSGLATAPIFTANTVAGSFVVGATAGAATNSFSLINNPDVPNSLVLIGGDGQSTTVNTTFTNPLLVEVRDQYGNVIPNATVNFTAPGAGASGTAANSSIATDANGQASTTFTANTIAGSYAVSVTAGAANNGFNLSNQPGSPANLTFLNASRQTTFSPGATDTLQIQVTDQFGNPIPNLPVFLAAPSQGAGGTLSQTTLITDGAGIATTGFIANSLVGDYIITATAGAISQGLSFANYAYFPTILTDGSDNQLDVRADLSIPTEADQAFRRLDRALSGDYESYYDNVATSEVSLPQVQQTLKRAREERQQPSAIIYAVFLPQDSNYEDSARPDLLSASLSSLVRPEQARDDDRLELILITDKEDPIRYVTNATRAEVTSLARYYRMGVADPEDSQSFQVLSRQFYDWLLKPLESDLQRQGITNLVYTLDEGIRTIPLAAMMDGDSFVVERYALSIIPSFGLTEHSFIQLENQRTLATGADRFSKLEPLPSVPDELKMVQGQLGGGESLFNEAFTLSNLLTLQNEHHPGILHVATHAQFNPGAPQESFIQFWDSQLTLNQVKELNWGDSSLELLVLSACTTALGDQQAELGFAGIATASGVRSALGSLWFISDIGTLALMSEFYAQLDQNLTLSEALRHAQNNLINGTVRLDHGKLITSQGTLSLPADLNLPDTFVFNHPFYWSAFTLVGNPW
jgi:filamentous hemagglutinin family protein